MKKFKEFFELKEDLEREQELLNNIEVCPDCRYLSVTPKMSGVSCDNPDCEYWFCF